MNLSNYTPLCEAIVLLMQPLVEVVIHDLTTNKIAYINGALSKRKIGDPSLLEPNALDQKNIDTIVYPKINFNGKLIKSISVPLENKWLICINADVSIFSQMKDISEKFLDISKKNQPESLFKNDWQEKLHVAIHDFLNKEDLIFEKLNQSDKKNLTKYLFSLGAFTEKNSADYIAQILNLGRATVFKYLKEWRNQ